MTRDELLNEIAQKGYNISYSANLNFATYDIYTKVTKYISFFSLIGGVLPFIYPEFFGTKFVATCLLLIGIIGVYIEQFTDTIECYAQRGAEDTKRLNELKVLYYSSKDDTRVENREFPNGYSEILEVFYSQSETKQLVFSGWFAHFKMFSQKKHEQLWIEQQLGLSWWNDKLPGSFKLTLLFLFVCQLFYFILKCPKGQMIGSYIVNYICG